MVGLINYDGLRRPGIEFEYSLLLVESLVGCNGSRCNQDRIDTKELQHIHVCKPRRHMFSSLLDLDSPFGKETRYLRRSLPRKLDAVDDNKRPCGVLVCWRWGDTGEEIDKNGGFSSTSGKRYTETGVASFQRVKAGIQTLLLIRAKKDRLVRER